MQTYDVRCPVHGVLMPQRVSSFGPWYGCPEPGCEYRVGGHRGTGEPLGTPTNAEGREARKRAHAAFDALWRREYEGNSRRRARAYRWLAHALGLPEAEAHVGRMDPPTCDRVVAAVELLHDGDGDTAHTPYPAVLLSPAFAPPEGDTSEVVKGLPRWELA